MSNQTVRPVRVPGGRTGVPIWFKLAAQFAYVHNWQYFKGVADLEESMDIV